MMIMWRRYIRCAATYVHSAVSLSSLGGKLEMSTFFKYWDDSSAAMFHRLERSQCGVLQRRRIANNKLYNSLVSHLTYPQPHRMLLFLHVPSRHSETPWLWQLQAHTQIQLLLDFELAPWWSGVIDFGHLLSIHASSEGLQTFRDDWCGITVWGYTKLRDEGWKGWERDREGEG